MAKLEPRLKDTRPLNIAIFVVLCYSQYAFALPFFSVFQKNQNCLLHVCFCSQFPSFSVAIKELPRSCIIPCAEIIMGRAQS